MRKSQLLVVSIPPSMMREVERLKKAEHRTRSELVREALRAYFALAARFPQEEATPAEIRALVRARREIASGDYVTLEQLERELDRPPLKGSRKNNKTRSRA
jgi:metal-responsive CopG/Arc/MetJ family transcriptional regulator